MSRILLLHGPNLNLLGRREPHHYGVLSLDEINQRALAQAEHAGHELIAKQSNAEHELVDWVQTAATDGVDFIVINPAAFSHTSVALRDAMIASALPFIEVHLSNIYRREAFRHHSYFSDIAVGVISGLGAQGYELGIQAALAQLDSPKNN